MPILRRTGWILSCLFCGIALCLPARMSAQESPDPETLKDATLVMADGDSLRGQVVLSAWNPTPQKVPFRRHERAPFVTYHASDLRTVALDDGPHLVRRTVTLDLVPDDPWDAHRFLRSDRPTTKTDMLLLERRVRGPMRFYVWRGDRTRYFVESDGNIAELVKHTWFVSSERRIVTHARYRRELADRMQECPKLKEELEHLDLQLQPLVKLVAAYNRCVTGDDNTAFAVEGTPLYRMALGPIIAVSRSTLRVPGAFGSEAVSGQSYAFDWKTQYMAGIWGLVRPSWGGNHWALYGQFAGFKQAFYGRTQENAAGQYREVDLQRTSLHLTALVRYYATAFDWQPYAEFGPSADYAVRSTNRRRWMHRVDGSESSVSPWHTALYDYQPLSFGLAAGLGVEAGRWTVGLRAEYTNGFSGRVGFATRALHAHTFVAFHL